MALPKAKIMFLLPYKGTKQSFNGGVQDAKDRRATARDDVTLFFWRLTRMSHRRHIILTRHWHLGPKLG